MPQATAKQLFKGFISDTSNSIGVDDPAVLRYRNNPNLFFKEKLGITFYQQLASIADDIFGESSVATTVDLDNGNKPKRIKRFSISAGQGIGKTTLNAAFVLYYLFIYSECKIITTAGRLEQVEGQIWKEISTLFYRAREKDPDFLGAKTQCNKTSITIAPNRTAIGATARPENSGTFRGGHESNVLIIIDEASTVDDNIYQALLGSTGGKNATLILTSNPGLCSGFFYKSFGDKYYKNYYLSVVDMVAWYRDNNVEMPGGLSTQDFINEQADTYGVSSPIYAWRVLGKFSNIGTGKEVIYPSTFDDNISHIRETSKRLGNCQIGVDIAIFGDDATTIYVLDDMGLLEVRELHQSEQSETCAQIAELSRTYNVSGPNIKIDSTGNGATFAGYLFEKYGLEVEAINFANSAQDSETYANKPTEMYFTLKHRLMDQKYTDANGNINENYFHLNYNGMPTQYLDKLRIDLCTRLFGYTKHGAFILEQKKEFKKRNGVSCDHGDAISLSLYDNSSGFVFVGNQPY
jgi:hypothetical protein